MTNSALRPSDFRWFMREYAGNTESVDIPEDIKADINETLIELASLYEGSDPSGFLRSAPRNPGYLKAACGEWKVFVPWLLARYFPDENSVLDEFDFPAAPASMDEPSLTLSVRDGCRDVVAHLQTALKGLDEELGQGPRT